MKVDVMPFATPNRRVAFSKNKISRSKNSIGPTNMQTRIYFWFLPIFIGESQVSSLPQGYEIYKFKDACVTS